PGFGQAGRGPFRRQRATMDSRRRPYGAAAMLTRMAAYSESDARTQSNLVVLAYSRDRRQYKTAAEFQPAAGADRTYQRVRTSGAPRPTPFNERKNPQSDVTSPGCCQRLPGLFDDGFCNFTGDLSYGQRAPKKGTGIAACRAC